MTGSDAPRSDAPRRGDADACDDLRDLLARQALASERYRAVAGRRLGLDDTETCALAELAQAGELTPGDLGARLSLSSGGTTALLQRLERDGHVERRRNPHDRRSVVVHATERTRALLDASVAPLAAAIDAAVATLSPAERETVRAWLARTVAAIEQELAEVIATGAEDAAEGGREDAVRSGSTS